MEKKVLVLGLERSGKSTLVSQIVKDVSQKNITLSTLYKPTEGFNVTSLSDGTSPDINIWESKKMFLFMDKHVYYLKTNHLIIYNSDIHYYYTLLG